MELYFILNPFFNVVKLFGMTITLGQRKLLNWTMRMN